MASDWDQIKKMITALNKELIAPHTRRMMDIIVETFDRFELNNMNNDTIDVVIDHVDKISDNEFDQLLDEIDFESDDTVNKKNDNNKNNNNNNNNNNDDESDNDDIKDEQKQANEEEISLIPQNIKQFIQRPVCFVLFVCFCFCFFRVIFYCDCFCFYCYYFCFFVSTV